MLDPLVKEGFLPGRKALIGLFGLGNQLAACKLVGESGIRDSPVCGNCGKRSAFLQGRKCSGNSILSVSTHHSKTEETTEFREELVAQWLI